MLGGVLPPGGRSWLALPCKPNAQPKALNLGGEIGVVALAIVVEKISFGTLKPRSQLDDPRGDLLIDLTAPTGGVEPGEKLRLWFGRVFGI